MLTTNCTYNQCNVKHTSSGHIWIFVVCRKILQHCVSKYVCWVLSWYYLDWSLRRDVPRFSQAQKKLTNVSTCLILLPHLTNGQKPHLLCRELSVSFQLGVVISWRLQVILSKRGAFHVGLQECRLNGMQNHCKKTWKMVHMLDQFGR